MARETKVIKCPNDEVNGVIALYEKFGWELVSNNICSGYTAGNGTNSVSIAAGNEITFSREKDSPWYDEVRVLEIEYEQCQREIHNLWDEEPEKEGKEFHLWLFAFGLWFFGISLIYLAVYLVQMVNRKNRYKNWHQVNDPKIKELEERSNELIAKSSVVLATR